MLLLLSKRFCRQSLVGLRSWDFWHLELLRRLLDCFIQRHTHRSLVDIHTKAITKQNNSIDMLLCELPSGLSTFLAWHICLHIFGQKFSMLSFLLQLVLRGLVILDLLDGLQGLWSEAFNPSRIVDETAMGLDVSKEETPDDQQHHGRALDHSGCTGIASCCLTALTGVWRAVRHRVDIGDPTRNFFCLRSPLAVPFFCVGSPLPAPSVLWFLPLLF